MNPWNHTPIIGQAPMDGVTDAAFRYITDLYGKPDVLFTEFVNVEGLGRNAVKLLNAFIKHTTATPIIGQLYGTDLHHFYNAALIVAELGFSGMDINMGCPASNIARRGAGAGLIRTPDRAKEIIHIVKKASLDFADGATIDSTDATKAVKKWVHDHKPENVSRSILPISVKTRIGYDEIITTEWMQHLLEASPTAITIHGRTLKQMYTGIANWDEIGKASEIAKGSGVKILGNGDVSSLEDANEKIQTYNLDGVLIGRASFGNPWIFKGIEVSIAARLQAALEHCRAFQSLTLHAHFAGLRKHMVWYCKFFRNSASVRDQLMHIETVQDVENILIPIISSLEQNRRSAFI